MSKRRLNWETDLLFIEINRLVCGLCDYEPKNRKTQKLEAHYQTHLIHGVNVEQLREKRQKKIKLLSSDNNSEAFSETSSQMSIDLSQPSTSHAHAEKDHLSEPQKRVKTSYQIAELIAKSGHNLGVSELIKDCMKLAAANLLPEQYHDVFDEIPLSRYTITNRIKDISDDIENQLNEKQFVDYSLSFDETTDVIDTPFLATFIRGVDENFTVTEELLSLKPFDTTTTGKDIFERLPLNSKKQGSEQAQFNNI